MDTAQIETAFADMTGRPLLMTILMIVVVLLCFGICAMGLQKGVERVTKVMMISLFIMMIVLAIHSVTLDGGLEGLKFYLVPDFGRLAENGLWEAIYAAMGQSFFTLSLGIGAIAIFGSYIDKDRRLAGEVVSITALDTTVALISGLIIFPACFAYGVNPGEGPSLIFITPSQRIQCHEIRQCMGDPVLYLYVFAAASTVIAVFENIISFATDLTGCSRRKAVLVNIIVIIVLSMPCVLGFNVLSGFTPLGAGSNIMDLEDFIVSNNLLPLGSLVYLLFCVTRYGWGWDNFISEANTGKGLKFPLWMRRYVTFVLPVIVLFIFVWGYLSKFVF